MCKITVFANDSVRLGNRTYRPWRIPKLTPMVRFLTAPNTKKNEINPVNLVLFMEVKDVFSNLPFVTCGHAVCFSFLDDNYATI